LNVPPNGYAWWYVDALSDDGEKGLTIIAFIGSVFSPYYAYARRKGLADPHNHVAFNVALYGKAARAWTMTERGSSALECTKERLSIGPSSVRWDGTALTIDIDEIAFPILKRVKGQIRVTPSCQPAQQFQLDAAGTQIWQPIAPRADISVAFSAPSLSWNGHAYFDHNRGSQPLEKTFQRWNWQRQNTPDSTRILYDVTERGRAGNCLALEIAADGTIAHLPAPPLAPLPSGRLWRVARGTRSDAGRPAEVLETFEDTPFYARSLVSSCLWGDAAPSIHESLDLDRFALPVVQAMLPFRMPRRAG
jgi:carotenoid 1,2-hydratase